RMTTTQNKSISPIMNGRNIGLLNKPPPGGCCGAGSCANRSRKLIGACRVGVGETFATIGTFTLGSRVPPGKASLPERLEAAFTKRGPSVCHEPKIKGDVVQTQQCRSEHLVSREQVVQIRPRVVAAAVAGATGLDRGRVSPVFGVSQPDRTLGRE